ncbi:hypothetical protein [uncultured Thiocystis sp.]|uniref:hypothetical protein n=1 Tax=uncultured Thiocystis sp. TaxID=1202134 RepID=UPI0034237126
MTDLAAAHVSALQALLNGAQSNAYNLGTGEGHSVLAVLNGIRGVTGRALPVQFAPRRSGDPARLVADASRVARELHWTPLYSDLEQMIQDADRWHRERHFSPRAPLAESGGS